MPPTAALFRCSRRRRRCRLRRCRGNSHLSHSRKGQLIELIASLPYVLQQSLTHAARPEFVDVIGNAVQRHLSVSFGAEEITDVVRHPDDVLGTFATHIWIVSPRGLLG